MKTENNHELCPKCARTLTHYHKRVKKMISQQFDTLGHLKYSQRFQVSEHGFEKGLLKGINFELPDEKNFACTGVPIDAQVGKNEGEFKFILFKVRNGEPLHYVFLKEPSKNQPSLLNVYNPTEGMSFKWTPSGKKRIYLNLMRNCCIHPEDHEEYHKKAHHGVQHKAYN